MVTVEGVAFQVFVGSVAYADGGASQGIFDPSVEPRLFLLCCAQGIFDRFQDGVNAGSIDVRVAVSGTCPEISPALAKLKVLVRTRSPKKLKHRCMSESKVVTDSILQKQASTNARRYRSSSWEYVFVMPTREPGFKFLPAANQTNLIFQQILRASEYSHLISMGNPCRRSRCRLFCGKSIRCASARPSIACSLESTDCQFQGSIFDPGSRSISLHCPRTYPVVGALA